MADGDQALPAGSRPVVLAVDDYPSMLELLAVVLEPDYELVTATDGAAALKVLASRRVDAVLLDVLLPGMHGLDVLLTIKALDPALAVILISGLADAPMIVRGMRFGAFDYVTKPFAEPHLRHLVAGAVKARRANPQTVLLIGAEPAFVATLAVFLSRYVDVATAAPSLGGLPDPLARNPLVVVYHGGGAPDAPSSTAFTSGTRNCGWWP